MSEPIAFYGRTILGNPIPMSYRAPIVGTFSIAELKQVIAILESRANVFETGLANTCYLVPVDQKMFVTDSDRDRWADSWSTLLFQIKGYEGVLRDAMSSTFNLE